MNINILYFPLIPEANVMEKVYINTEYIKLQQALKLANIVGSGSDAKLMIQEGFVYVNGQLCTMRGKKLRNGDKVKVSGEIVERDYEFVIAYHEN